MIIMKRKHHFVWLWCSLDILVAVLATVLTLLLITPGTHATSVAETISVRITVKNLLLLALFLMIWIGIHEFFGLHDGLRDRSQRALIARAIAASALGSIFFLFFPLTSQTFEGVWKPELVYFTGALCCSILMRTPFWLIGAQLDRVSTPKRVLIVGSGPLAAELRQNLLSAERPVHILGFIDSVVNHVVPEEISSALLGTVEDLESILVATAIDEVTIALPLRSCYDQIQNAIKTCERVGVPAAYAFRPFTHELGCTQFEQYAAPFIRWKPSRGVESDLIKRAIDLFGALFGLVVLAPLFLAIAIAVAVTSRGAIFFVQERYGLNKRKFRMHKFRTMVADAEVRQSALEGQNEARGPVFKIKNDPRITHIGFFLRKSSLDELPQLWNVLQGDMSLVGPRPLPNRDVSRFDSAWLMRRFSVKPGLTCLWQISGRSESTFDQWITLDLKYIDDWSLGLDASIIAKTIPAVLKGKGAM